MALLALAAGLGFELRQPLFSLGPLGVTNVELLLYLCLGLWALSGPRPVAGPLHWAALAWVVALLAASAAAPEHRGEAVRFALREIGGAALLLVVADQSAAPRRALALAVAYAGGAGLSALAGIAEALSPAAAAALLCFKQQPSLVDGALRASGSLQYANLAAMSWGMALPMAVALAGRPGGRRLVWGGAALVIALGLVLSASRAGVATASLVLGALAWAGAGLGGLRRFATITLVGLAAFAATALAAHGSLALRLRPWEDRPWFEAEFLAREAPVLDAGRAGRVRLRVRNQGRLRWWASGEHAMGVAYAWLDDPVPRAAATLPRDVEPGASVELEARIVAPAAAGRHRLRWFLSGSGIAWLNAGPAGASELELEVRPVEAGPELAAPVAAVAPLRLQAQPTRPALWRAALVLWRQHPLLGVGPDNFRRLYSRVLGPRSLDERVHANSLYFEVLATLGLLGAAALVGLMVAVAAAGRRALACPEPGKRLLAAGALGGLAACFVHGAVDYGLEATAGYGAFWLLAGLLAGASSACPSAAEIRRATSSSPAGAR